MLSFVCFLLRIDPNPLVSPIHPIYLAHDEREPSQTNFRIAKFGEPTNAERRPSGTAPRSMSIGRLDSLVEKVTVAMVSPYGTGGPPLFGSSRGRPTPVQSYKGENWTNQFAVFEIRLPRRTGPRLADVQRARGAPLARIPTGTASACS